MKDIGKYLYTKAGASFWGCVKKTFDKRDVTFVSPLQNLPAGAELEKALNPLLAIACVLVAQLS